jgi:hypothetical protein
MTGDIEEATLERWAKRARKDYDDSAPVDARVRLHASIVLKLIDEVRRGRSNLDAERSIHESTEAQMREGMRFWYDNCKRTEARAKSAEDATKSCPRHPHWSGTVLDCVFCTGAVSRQDEAVVRAEKAEAALRKSEADAIRGWDQSAAYARKLYKTQDELAKLREFHHEAIAEAAEDLAFERDRADKAEEQNNNLIHRDLYTANNLAAERFFRISELRREQESDRELVEEFWDNLIALVEENGDVYQKEARVILKDLAEIMDDIIPFHFHCGFFQINLPGPPPLLQQYLQLLLNHSSLRRCENAVLKPYHDQINFPVQIEDRKPFSLSRVGSEHGSDFNLSQHSGHLLLGKPLFLPPFKGLIP